MSKGKQDRQTNKQRERELTVSMFTEAASLDTHSQEGTGLKLEICGLFRHLRSVVIITIDVKHLISLDTENTVYRKYQSAIEKREIENRGQYHTQTAHTPSNLHRQRVVSRWSSGGVACSSTYQYQAPQHHIRGQCRPWWKKAEKEKGGKIYKRGRVAKKIIERRRREEREEEKGNAVK